MKYQVRFMMDSTYEVVAMSPKYPECDYNTSDDDYDIESVHQGSISDCEAYIRLKVNGYM